MSGQALAHRATRHTTWCARGHRCTLGEHRGEPLRVNVDGAGSLIITRVRSTDGTEWAEVRGSLRLDDGDRRARGQLVSLVDSFARLMWRAGRTGGGW